MRVPHPLVPVILCGGSGSRLWPLSRELYPKQLLSLVSDSSLLQETARRMDGCAERPILVCNEEHRFLVSQQLGVIGIRPAATLLEPFGRNTAPAVAVAALAALALHSDPVLLVLPSDHAIGDVEGFRRAVQLAQPLAEAGFLVTFGVLPRSAETGYGYLQRGEPTQEQGGYRVTRFVEKPDAGTAASYLASGDYYWNSGMFAFRAGEYLRVLADLNPAMASACRSSWEGAARDLDFTRLQRSSFEACPADSIDYAVMEKASRVAMVPLDVRWSDVGSWAALHEIAGQDESGNVRLGDVLLEDTRNSYLRAEHRMIAAVGVRDAVVVETADAVLVADRNRVQDVKKIVAALKRDHRSQHLLHTRVYRPWGSYEGIDQGPRHQVKRLRVNPGARLSLQEHAHRAEHWVVVRGRAEVVNGERLFVLEENESTYIPAGTRHRLGNPFPEVLEVIEVQTGDYLGEDDIRRYEDDFGR